MEKCIICQEDTDQCCSLCRKAFYCSQDHQETDWHMKHKHICEGRKSMQMVDNSREEFRIYPHSVSKSSAQTIKNETQAKHFFGLYSLRQANRKKLIDKYQNSEAEECRKMVHELL